jgi:hypothetical protein
MLKSLIAVKKEKAQVFQVLLLDNGSTQDVEVEEAEHVDFARVQEHLAGGGAVFITSKTSQKIKPPRDKKGKRKLSRIRNATAFQLDNL